METIRSYLDNMFRAIPYTPETARLRADLLANMEDKYNELKAEGRSENEAVGIVISEFGNIDEILAEMGMQGDSSYSGDERPFGRTVNQEEALRFIGARRTIALLIAAGVFLCIMSPAVFVLLDEMMVRVRSGVSDVLCIAVFLSLIAAAVGMFIYSGYLGEPFKYLQKEPFTLTPDARDLAGTQLQALRGKTVLTTILGVIIILMSPVVFMLFAAIGRPYAIGIAVMLFMIAIAVFGFGYSGTLSGSYDILLQRKGYAPSYKRQQDDKIVAAVAAVWWPLCVCIYLGWSFWSGRWGITWIIWPVSALLFGAFAGARSILTGRDSDY